MTQLETYLPFRQAASNGMVLVVTRWPAVQRRRYECRHVAGL